MTRDVRAVTGAVTSRPAGGPRSWLARVDARLVAPGTVHRLACVRTALAAVLGLRIAVGAWADLAARPDAAWSPIWILSWLDGVPPAGALVTVQVVGALAAVLAAAGRWPRATFAIAWCALLVLAGVHTSFGKIMHNDVLLILACVPLLAAPGGARLGDLTRSPAYGWVPRASLALVGTVYFLTGLQKLLHSGPAWFLGDTMSWVLYQGADAGVAPAVARWLAGLPVVPHAFALGAVTIELAAPLILYVRRTRPFYVLAALAMHGSITLLLGLDYTSWVLTVAAVALPWDRLAGSLTRWGRRAPAEPEPVERRT